MAKVLVFRRNEGVSIEEIHGYKDGQKIVGGLISPIYPIDIDYDNDHLCLIGDDESKLSHKEPHALLLDEEGNLFDCINGDFYLLRVDDNGNDTDITLQDVIQWMGWYENHVIDKDSFLGAYLYDSLLKYTLSF